MPATLFGRHYRRVHLKEFVFLKAVIRLPEDDYSEITVVDPHLMRKHPDKKLGILDLQIKSKSGKIVHVEIHTLELPKLPETADNYLWHWLRFLRAGSKEDLDMVAQASPELKKTVVKLLELSEDEETRMIYEAEVKAARDERARMHGA
jgi:hypothetical protein